MSAAVNGMKVAGLAFGGTKIAGLCKAGEVFWRLVEKVKSEWTDRTDEFIAHCSLPSGVSIARDGDEYVFTVTSDVADGTRILGFDHLEQLSDLGADYPESGTLRVTCERTDVDFSMNSNSSGISANWAPFQVEGPTKASSDMWWGLWLRQSISTGTYRFLFKVETKPS